MPDDKNINVLFEILSSEQQILQRADQKAFTLLSLLGVFAVFFIVHYTKIPPTFFTLTIITLYFLSVLISVFFLVSVVTPRIRESEESANEDDKTVLPTFFGGIVKYKSPHNYAKQLKEILNDSEQTYMIFAKSVYSISRINAYKHKYLKYGIRAFVLAVAFEFTIIVTLYANLLMVEGL